MDPLATARYGMMAAESRLAASAGRVAAGGDELDLAREAVAQIQARTQFGACAKVVSFAGEMWRSLMDVQAR